MKFRLLFQTDRKYRFRGFVDVEVFPNVGMLQAALIDENTTFDPGGPKSGRTTALMEPVIGGEVFAKIYFAEDELDMRSIMHECYHVTKEWIRRSKVRREEAEAYGLERLVMKVVRGIKKRGGHIYMDSRLKKSVASLH